MTLPNIPSEDTLRTTQPTLGNPMNLSTHLRFWLFIFAAPALAGCLDSASVSDSAPTTASVAPCSTDGVVTAWCGYKNAEDLVATPDGKFLLATGLGSLGEPYATEMTLINLTTMANAPLQVVMDSNSWGDPACTRTSTEFSTHGMDLTEREDGRQMVAVTNHFPKETVEFFELESTEAGYQLIWRGCVESPTVESGARQPMFNDLALTSDGGFYTTEMYNLKLPFGDVLAAGLAGADSGQVWSWNAEDGFQAIAGTEGGFPNGIVITNDEKTLFINYWFSGKTQKFDIASGAIQATHLGGRADNLTMAEGSVWAAKHDMTITEYLESCPADATNCFLPFSIHELDTGDLQEKRVWTLGSDTFGFATVATPVAGRVWLGTAHGDRVASFDIASKP